MIGSEGKFKGDPVPISKGFNEQHAQVVYDFESDQFLVSWTLPLIIDGNFQSEFFGRWLSSKGEAIEEEEAFSIAQVPAVTGKGLLAMNRQGILVVWEEESPGGYKIRGQHFERRPQSVAFDIVAEPGYHLRNPKAISLEDDFLVTFHRCLPGRTTEQAQVLGVGVGIGYWPFPGAYPGSPWSFSPPEGLHRFAGAGSRENEFVVTWESEGSEGESQILARGGQVSNN